MREIKFRAWDDDAGEMIFDVGIDENGIPYKFPEGDGSDSIMADAADYWPDAKLMQYTGLKDKNGVEIYEGDIVNTGNRYIQEVVFADACFCLKGGKSDTFLKRNFLLSVAPMHRTEVIGNIYENGDLLK